MRDDMSTSNQREVGREYSNGEGLPENSHLDLSQWRWFTHCRQPLPNHVTSELAVTQQVSRRSLRRLGRRLETRQGLDESPGDQPQILLGRFQDRMSHVAREHGQLLPQVFALSKPSLQTMHREGVSQIMHSW